MAGVLVAALPRAGWFALTAFMATGLLIHEHAGGALLLLAGALVPVVLSPRDGPAWPLSAGAPALGAIGLAGAWPAVAGLAGPLWRRAMLGATGWVWLALARATYSSSTSDALHHAITPLLTVGTLVGAGVWAAAAIVLPWAGIRRSPVLEATLLAGWAVGARAGHRRGLAYGRRSPANIGRKRAVGGVRRGICGACHKASWAPAGDREMGERLRADRVAWNFG